MGRTNSTLGNHQYCVQYFRKKPEAMGPLQGNRRNWEDDIKADLKKNEFEVGEDCVLVAQNPGQWHVLAKIIMNFKVS
jgi:hypothetical protein